MKKLLKKQVKLLRKNILFQIKKKKKKKIIIKKKKN